MTLEGEYRDLRQLSGIQYLRHSFFAARRFTSLDDLNRQLAAWIEDVAHARVVPGDAAQRLVKDALARSVSCCSRYRRIASSRTSLWQSRAASGPSCASTETSTRSRTLSCASPSRWWPPSERCACSTAPSRSRVTREATSVTA